MNEQRLEKFSRGLPTQIDAFLTNSNELRYLLILIYVQGTVLIRIRASDIFQKTSYTTYGHYEFLVTGLGLINTTAPVLWIDE